MSLIYTTNDNKYALELFYDIHALNPRDFRNLGTMVCYHKKYKLGDQQAENTGLYTGWAEWLKSEVLSMKKSGVVYLPLYLYDHSGLAINTTGYHCRWDSTQLGWIYVTKSKLKKAGIEEEVAEALLVEEVDCYDHYLQDQFLGYNLKTVNEKDSGALIDTRGGFYGNAVKENIKKALGNTFSYLIEGWEP